MIDWRWVLSRARWALLLVPIAWVALVVRHWGSLPPIPLLTDADAYHLAAEAIKQGGSPYYSLPVPGPHRYGHDLWYLYPPFLASALSFAGLSRAGTYTLMVLSAAASAMLFGYGIARLARVGGIWLMFAVSGAVLAFPGSLALVLTGNIQLVVDSMVVLALTTSAAPAAGLLVAAAALKVTPIWGAAVVLVRGGKRALLGGGLAALVVIAITLGALGVDGTVDAYRTWFTQVAPTLSQGQFDNDGGWVYWNLSPVFAPLMILTGEPPIGESIPAMARVYLVAMQLAIPLATIWLTRRRPGYEQAGWVIVAATLSAPIVRSGYLPILLIAPALWFHRRSSAVAPDGRPDSSNQPIIAR